MDFTIDLNHHYPLKDFMEDMNSIIKIDDGNVIDFPPQFGIINDENGQVTNYRFNTTDPMYISSKFFIDKYGSSIGPALWMKFIIIGQFIFKWKSVLIKHKLLLKDELAIKDEFLGHLLNVKINSRSRIIPKKEIYGFLKKQHDT